MRLAAVLLLMPLSLEAAPTAPADAAPPGRPALAPMDEAMLANQYGGRVEVRLDADFNGDGDPDTAAVMRDDGAETRRLVVALGYRNEVDMGHEPIGEAAMDPYPLGDARLRVDRRGVLLVEDLAGGTSAIASTYRYRFDPATRRMRLIGDDVHYYSRTNQHDQVRISTNRLTGVQLRRVDRLAPEGAEEAYLPGPEERRSVPTAPIYMEDAPAPEDTLGLGG